MILRFRMLSSKLTILALSEVRLRGSGTIDVVDGFTLVFQGYEQVPGQRGVGFLLSLAGSEVWKRSGSQCQGSAGGRLLNISLKSSSKEPP